MKKLLLALTVFCLSLLLPGCSGSSHEGFAIYLTKDDIPPAQMPALSHVDLADKPVIALRDIVSYNAQTHELLLTESAFERICQLKVPVGGKCFLVCVDQEPVYWGAFWTPVSSISFDGVTIWQPFDAQQIPVVALELGYPSALFYGGEDPRNNVEVMQSLERAGKLVNKLSISEAGSLPHSMKGYELYSWPQSGEWHFTLITGTNRNKTLEEITSPEDYVSTVGWIKVHAIGMENMKVALGKLPQSEFVIWLAELREPTGQTSEIQLPPMEIISEIKAYADSLGIQMQIVQ